MVRFCRADEYMVGIEDAGLIMNERTKTCQKVGIRDCSELHESNSSKDGHGYRLHSTGRTEKTEVSFGENYVTFSNLNNGLEFNSNNP